MKKKLTALALVICLLAVAIVGGTLAYFTDTDSAKNVMVVGSVEIEQLEQERNASGGLQPFTQEKPLVPAVGTPTWAANKLEIGDVEFSVFDNAVFKNVIDKFISVNNTGNSDAYVRTIVALESPGAKLPLGVNVNTVVYDQTVTWTPVTVNGVEYEYSVFTLKEELAADTEGPACFHQVYLKSEADNADVADLDGTFEILAVSQAVQADGFETPEDAFAAAFDEGEATPSTDDIAGWLATALA